MSFGLQRVKVIYQTGATKTLNTSLSTGGNPISFRTGHYPNANTKCDQCISLAVYTVCR
jgi:hypothetical protein